MCYCTNIHPGESWAEVFASLEYALRVRDRTPGRPRFGIGLRLSAVAARELGTGDRLRQFKDWLEAHRCYVFTINGFPYGGFHGSVVKDSVHAPDWTTVERVEYSKLLFDQLAYLLPEGMEGGVSTSPLSYGPWHLTDAARHRARETSARHLADVTAHLYQLRKSTGKLLHVDIEPEPDGLVEDNGEFIQFYNDYLLGPAAKQLAARLSIALREAEETVREHIRICYDICHYAVEFEDHFTALRQLADAGIKVGKIQISAALRADLGDPQQRDHVRTSLLPYNESTYLHQTVLRGEGGELTKFPDLGPALPTLQQTANVEVRTHFHVPIFSDDYGVLHSTRGDIEQVLDLWSANPFTNHLEVETYTWDVLPETHQLTLIESIHRELAWVSDYLQTTRPHEQNRRH